MPKATCTVTTKWHTQFESTLERLLGRNVKTPGGPPLRANSEVPAERTYEIMMPSDADLNDWKQQVTDAVVSGLEGIGAKETAIAFDDGQSVVVKNRILCKPDA